MLTNDVVSFEQPGPGPGQFSQSFIIQGKLFPFVKMVERHVGTSIHLKRNCGSLHYNFNWKYKKLFSALSKRGDRDN